MKAHCCSLDLSVTPKVYCKKLVKKKHDFCKMGLVGSHQARVSHYKLCGRYLISLKKKIMTVDWTNQSQGQFSKWENWDFGRKEDVQSRCMLTANLTHQQLSSQPGVGGNKQPLPATTASSHLPTSQPLWQRCEKHSGNLRQLTDGRFQRF